MADGHEREDVVNHRKGFVSRFRDLESRLARWYDEGNFIGDDVPPGVGKWFVVVTRDESTFHVNDGRRQMWLKDKGDLLRPKGNGKGIMISDVLTLKGRFQAPSQITEDTLMAHNVGYPEKQQPFSNTARIITGLAKRWLLKLWMLLYHCSRWSFQEQVPRLVPF